MKVLQPSMGNGVFSIYKPVLSVMTSKAPDAIDREAGSTISRPSSQLHSHDGPKSGEIQIDFIFNSTPVLSDETIQDSLRNILVVVAGIPRENISIKQCNLVITIYTLQEFLRKVVDAIDQEVVIWRIFDLEVKKICICLLYTSPSPRDRQKSRMPSSA